MLKKWPVRGQTIRPNPEAVNLLYAKHETRDQADNAFGPDRRLAAMQLFAKQPHRQKLSENGYYKKE